MREVKDSNVRDLSMNTTTLCFSSGLNTFSNETFRNLIDFDFDLEGGARRLVTTVSLNTRGELCDISHRVMETIRNKRISSPTSERK